MFINKLDVVLSFQNLKNIDIACIFFIAESFLFLFSQSIFLYFKHFPRPHFCDLSSFLTYLPILKNYLHPTPYAHSREVISPA